METTTCDLLVIGGGINGAGIARDAAGRGLTTVLCEKDDLAQHTSSASTKLIHGGLRYLEHYDFMLVRKALIEREVLLEAAPHIIWPMRFVLPHQTGQRPAWLIRLGLFLYDHLGGRKRLPATQTLHRKKTHKFNPLRPEFRLAFEYSDCWVEDSRLVVLNAVDAADRGAEVLTRTRCSALKREGDVWTATLSLPTGETRRVEARAIVNAAGPWVDDVDGLASPGRNQGHVRLVKGSHIITRKLYDGDHAYFFQNADGRIMFAIPYERGAFTLIGTTDVPFTADRDRVEASPEEVHYLCEGASTYFQTPIAPQDVVATYSGVRPLYDDQSENASEVTRDYVLSLNDDGPPILSVFGGKITTYRKLAEGALKTLAPFFPNLAPEWTECSPLPGGDMPGADFDSFFTDMAGTYPWLPADWARRFARAYGTRMIDLIGEATSVEDLGQHFGGGLTEAEVTYLIANEFVQSADDVLWRRSKLGLHLSEEEITAVSAWFERRPVQADPSASR